MFTRKVIRAIAKIKDPSGGVIISFAIFLPLLITLLAFCLNSLKMFIAKAKMGDVASEIGLMVSASSSLGEDERTLPPALQNMLTKYVREFFPESTKTPKLSITYSKVDIDVKDNASYMTYKPNIEVELPFPFYNHVLSDGKKNFTVSSSYLNVKKKVSRPVDIVFVMDFSTSQQGYGITLLKQTFKELTEFILKSNPKSKVAMVPFSIGVAVKYPENNQRGGPKAGCSVLFVPKKGWDINYSFWGDKYINSWYKNINEQTYSMDDYRYRYYTYQVRQSRPALSLQSVLDKWCRKNDTYGKGFGRENYSCFDKRFTEKDASGNTFYSDDIFSKKSLEIITNEYAKAAKVRDAQNRYFTIENIDAIDFPETLKKMFSDEAIITFPMLWAGMWDSNYRTFKEMCHNTGWWDNSGQLADAKLHSWLIELTNDAKELEQFQNMKAQGWTATTSGLVRSVPVMMKGRNPRKIFVIMSDGDDSSGPQLVTDRYLKDYKLCDKIKEGIMDRPETNTERVDIYYVSTTNSSMRVNYWRNYCTGEGNSTMAVNRKQVVDLIKGYLSDEIGNFSH